MNTLSLHSVGSTNQFAKSICDGRRQSDAFPMLITAQEQTEGQGSNGRLWFSPKDCGVYLSFITKQPELVHVGEEWIIAQTIGHALQWELRDYTRQHIERRGVNDLYLNGRKLAGILCEIYKGYLIIGVGLNIFRPKRFPKEFAMLKKTAIWLDECTTSSLCSKLIFTNLITNTIADYLGIKACQQS